MKHRNRTIFVMVFAVVATLGAGTVFAYGTNSGAVSSGSWKTAAGVSLQVPTTGTPKLAFTAQPGAGARIRSTGRSPFRGPASPAAGHSPGSAQSATRGPASTSGGHELAITSMPVSGTATASPSIGPIHRAVPHRGRRSGDHRGTVDLSSSSIGANEFSASSGGTRVSSIVILPGSSTASFYYGDELAGTPDHHRVHGRRHRRHPGRDDQCRAAAGLSFTGVTTGTGHTTRSAAVTCTSGAAACTLSPQAPAGKSRFMSAQVTLVDQFQNPVASSSGSAVTVSLSQAGGDALSGTSVSIPAGASSSATFTEKLADGKAQATVTATATLGSARATASLTS